MISYLQGTIIAMQPREIVLEVHGVGFELLISDNTQAQLPNIGEQAQLWVYMQIREDAITLLGFHSLDEKNTYKRLIEVSGIGAKVSMNLLSQFTPDEIAIMILNEDIKKLSTTPGIGVKTAERIVFELKSKYEEDAKYKSFDTVASLPTTSVVNDVRQALLGMGFTEEEISLALDAAPLDSNDASTILGFALKKLGGNA